MSNRVDPYDVMAEEQRLIAMATSRLHDAIGAAGLTQAELANRIGKSASHVSQVLDGTRNMTLRTIARFGLACGVRWTFKQVASLSYATTREPGGEVAAVPGKSSRRQWRSTKRGR